MGNGAYQVEVAADTLQSCLEAQRGGASRVELCTGLSTGGLTPSAALVSMARKHLSIPLYTLIRPREGDFVYDHLEISLMLEEIDHMKSLNSNGIVCGALNPDGTVNEEATREMVLRSAPLPVTFHRAFDVTPSQPEALEAIVRAGCTRILTSGGKPTAWDGRDSIRKLVRQAGGRIVILPGGRVDINHLEELVNAGCTEVHLSGRMKVASGLSSDLYEMDYHQTDHSVIRSVVDILSQLSVESNH